MLIARFNQKKPEHERDPQADRAPKKKKKKTTLGAAFFGASPVPGRNKDHTGFTTRPGLHALLISDYPPDDSERGRIATIADGNGRPHRSVCRVSQSRHYLLLYLFLLARGTARVGKKSRPSPRLCAGRKCRWRIVPTIAHGRIVLLRFARRWSAEHLMLLARFWCSWLLARLDHRPPDAGAPAFDGSRLEWPGPSLPFWR